MEHIPCIVLFMAVLLTAGCLNPFTALPAPPAPTPVPTPAPAPGVIPVPEVLLAVSISADPVHQEDTGDTEFLEATDRCYAGTPVLEDTSTVLAFTVCMQHTPIPSGTCAKQFRSEVLAYTTKDDDTTAGYRRATDNMQVARTRFSQCLARFP